MSSQTVFRLTSRNGFDGLQVFNEPVPAAAKYEILVKVRSVALNYRDVAIASSKYPLHVKDQVIPCSDMAGVVEQVGEAVTDFSVGDSVLVPVNPTFLYGSLKNTVGHNSETYGGPTDGMLREYIALPAHSAIKLPRSTQDFASWAAVVATGSTVWNSFYGNVALKPGDTILLLGTGGVSMTALIFAKAAGATTIITSSSDKKLEQVKSRFGVDYTINYKTHPNWAAEVQRITNGQGADHVIEIGGSGTMQQSLESVAYGGHIAVVGFLSPAPPDKMPDVSMLAMVRNCVVRGIMSGSKQQLEQAVNFMVSRGIKVPVDKKFGFTRGEIIAGLNYVASGQHIGKVCIDLS